MSVEIEGGAFRSNLQELRKEAGFGSARAFAERLGMSVRTYTNYEQGVSRISLEQAWRFADALGEAMGRYVTIDELAGREFPMSVILSPSEREIVESYRDSDSRGRDNIVATARREKRAARPSEGDMSEAV